MPEKGRPSFFGYFTDVQIPDQTRINLRLIPVFAYILNKNTEVIVKILMLLMLLSIPLITSGQDSQDVIILHTTDLHGSVYPYDYFRDMPADNGLAKVYTVVKKYRQQYKNVLLLDSGDLIQGNPMIYYFNKIENQMPNPMTMTMNYMRYEAFAVGNHDIEQGYAVYDKARRESDFPWLSANGLYPDGAPFFKPYTIIEKNGIKIGIIGLTTPAIPMWLDSSLYPGITWQDMIESAQHWARILRPQVDILLGIFHAGMNEEYSSAATDALGLPNENATKMVAEQVPGFDAIFCGHSHQRYPYGKDDPPKINGALMLMSGSHGRYLGVAQFVMSGKKIKQSLSTIMAMDTVSAAQEILDLNREYHDKTLAYIRQTVGTVSDTISAVYSRARDNKLVELINLAQMDITGADISFAASFDDRLILPPGPIKTKDIYMMYKYENFLYTIRMTGQQIKDYLEYSANYYIYDDAAGGYRYNPEMQGYNYDMAEGVSYEIHIKNQPGNRIQNLKLASSGKALGDKELYTVALNSYRASGGGGHLAAAGIKQADIVWKSSEEMRNILSEYIKARGNISGKVDGNWKIVLN